MKSATKMMRIEGKRHGCLTTTFTNLKECKQMDKEKKIIISSEELLKLFAEKDYPIRYSDGSYGRGMGYQDFEKLVKQIRKKCCN